MCVCVCVCVCYCGRYDDKLYEKETARAMLESLVALLQQCATHPDRELESLRLRSSASDSDASDAAAAPAGASAGAGVEQQRDHLGRAQLGAEATEFVNAALQRWQERLKAQAAEYRQGR